MSSPSELFSCVDATAILQSPINTSTAKNHWTFSKDNRFKRHQSYCDSFYEKTGVKENKNRMAGIGYGKKTDLEFNKHPHNITPSPDTYNLATFVEINKTHQKGFSPLYSRQEMAQMSYIQLEPYKVPGPGRYDEYRYNQTPKWTLHSRTQEFYPVTTVKIVPGPGIVVTSNWGLQFKQSSYNTSQSVQPSSFETIQQIKWDIFNIATDVPGPGVYQPQNDLSNEGKYVLSKNVSAGKRKFMDGRRLSFTDIHARRSFTPGPGSYRSPSDFGQYDIKKDLRASTSYGNRAGSRS